ncbi:hypothetical protein BDV38DRAFT_43425 [Aspergillus pseudotamarii]|uniref:Uncharacterized protein n=1 Tax=Aspergillus pseudotamarii TaxID=132259 RepID=A0A5N6SCG2_ASPPS|nr:uncharacterized protein BDV38DRAFT_43425 [Aspergillus pseudotamarii]KAE8130804.1 hypothetical protein BDV38DRAFT_43425 [Aspergillus pseudotamarii]
MRGNAGPHGQPVQGRRSGIEIPPGGRINDEHDGFRLSPHRSFATRIDQEDHQGLCQPLVQLGNIYIDPPESIGIYITASNPARLGGTYLTNLTSFVSFPFIPFRYTYIHVLRAHLPVNLVYYCPPFFILFFYFSFRLVPFTFLRLY